MSFTRSSAALLALAVLATGACKGDGDRHQFAGSTTSSSTSTSSTTTTATTAAPPPLSAATKLVVTATGVVAPVSSVNRDGTVSIRTPCERIANVRRVTAVGPVDVVIDPGHGGNESGAVGANGLAEKTVNLAVAQHMVKALTNVGLRPVLTRTGEYRITLQARANIGHAASPRVFVSIHHNGGSDGPRDGPGTEVFFQHASADSKRLSGLIYEELVKTFSQYGGVAWQADSDAGVKPRLNSSGQDYYGILRRPAPIVAALVESLFISNPPEAELLARPDVQAAEGDAVTRGIVRYLRTDDPGSGYVEPYARTEPAGPGGGLSGCNDPPFE